MKQVNPHTYVSKSVVSYNRAARLTTCFYVSQIDQEWQVLLSQKLKGSVAILLPKRFSTFEEAEAFGKLILGEV